MLLGRLTPSDGGVKLISVFGGLAPGLVTKINCDLNRRAAEQPVPSSCMIDANYRGSDWGMGMNAAMVEGEDPSLKWTFLQSITQRIALGGEGRYNVGTGEAHVAYGGCDGRG